MKKLIVPLIVFSSQLFSYERASDIYVDAEFLYWKAIEDGLSYATGFTLASGFTDVKELEWNWKPGFRVGVGSFLCNCANWNVSAIYTRFKSDASGNSFGDLNGIWNPNTILYNSASGKWKLQFETFDVNIAKTFFFGDCNYLEPFFCLRGARTKDTYDINYTTVGSSVQTLNDQRFWGIGPRFGFNSSWNVFCNFHVIGEGAISLLWSNYQVKRFDIPDATTGDNNTLHDQFDTTRTALEYRFGILWERSVFNSCFFNFLLAWEHQLWLDHNMMFFGPVGFDNFVENRFSNLSLFGLTARAQFIF